MVKFIPAATNHNPESVMKTYYVIRKGWNAANQSSMRRSSSAPRNSFDTNLLKLVAIVEAESESSACKQFTGTVYNGQILYATSNPRSVKGLAAAIRDFAEF